MMLTFYGAAQEVGRSCIVLEDRHKALMLDLREALEKKYDVVMPALGESYPL